LGTAEIAEVLGVAAGAVHARFASRQTLAAREPA
jgi:hypothetical protein